MTAQTLTITANFSPAFDFLFQDAPYKSGRGGRGAGKSWAFADAILLKGIERKRRILCCREYQSSINDSVYKLLCDRIIALGLQGFYKVNKSSITGYNGTEFIFKGLRINITEVKSTEGIDICWVEEAQTVSEDSWEILIPTIFRTKGSELWISWNTGEEEDPTYQRFVVNPPPGCISRLINWYDNDYFPEELRAVKDHCKKVDPEAYEHIWEGKPLKISDAVVFKGKFELKEFDTPHGVQLYYGADWGFSNDPSTLIRFFELDNDLYIEYEGGGVGVELEELPELWDSVPGSREHEVIADNARPETISFMNKKGFVVTACSKTSGTVEGFIRDGVEWLKKHEHIYIHPRCVETLNEFKHYKYKVDKNDKDKILPIIVDEFNHYIDALRYGAQELIRSGFDWTKVVS